MCFYGPWLKDKRARQAEQITQERAEAKRRREEREAQQQQTQAAGKPRVSWVDRLAAYAAHTDAVRAEAKRRKQS